LLAVFSRRAPRGDNADQLSFVRENDAVATPSQLLRQQSIVAAFATLSIETYPLEEVSPKGDRRISACKAAADATLNLLPALNEEVCH
jgi:hypothetical protein